MTFGGSVRVLSAVVAVAAFGLTGCAQSVPPVSEKVQAAYEAGKDLPTETATAAALPALKFSKGTKTLFFGDSWTFGMSATPETSGYAYQAADMLGLDADVSGGVGTGYVNPGGGQGNFRKRLLALPASSPALVIVQGSVNDYGKYMTSVEGAALDLIRQAKAKYPKAQIVMMGPATFTWPADAQLVRLDKTLAGVALASRVHYVSPVQGAWITAGNFDKVIDPETNHPSTGGHAYLASKLVAALNKLKG